MCQVDILHAGRLLILVAHVEDPAVSAVYSDGLEHQGIGAVDDGRGEHYDLSGLDIKAGKVYVDRQI